MASARPRPFRWLPLLATVAAAACASDAEPAQIPENPDTGAIDAAEDETVEAGIERDVGKDAGDAGTVGADVAMVPDAGDAEAPAVDREQPPVADASDASESPPLCARLEDPLRAIHVYELSAAVRGVYMVLVNEDCRVADLHNESMPARVNWYNALYAWSVELWGCKENRAKTFALVHEEVVDLTSADAALLIELYLQATKKIFELTMAEEAALRRDIQALATKAITRQSSDYTFSACGRLEAGTDGGAPDGGEPRPDASADGEWTGDAGSQEESGDATGEPGEDAEGD